MKDNCTLFPEGNWTDCCLGHDYDYGDGGNLWDKIKADWKLANCVRKKVPIVGSIMFIGLSCFGYFNFSWRHK